MASDAFNIAAHRQKDADKLGRIIKTEEDFRTASIQMTDGSQAQVRAGKIISRTAPRR